MKLTSGPAPAGATYVPAEVPQYNGVANFLETQRLVFRESAKFEAAQMLGLPSWPRSMMSGGENDCGRSSMNHFGPLNFSAAARPRQ